MGIMCGGCGRAPTKTTATHCDRCTDVGGQPLALKVVSVTPLTNNAPRFPSIPLVPQRREPFGFVDE